MIKLAPIFTDHAVLQRDKKIRIFGYTDKKTLKVSVIDENGANIYQEELEVEKFDDRFEIVIGPIAGGGPYALEVLAGTGNSAGETEVISLKDIYFGDVYLAGGQSNMEFELQNSRGASEEIANCENERIRFYYTPKVAWLGEELEQAENESEWKLCKPENVANWSAIGYYFAKALTEEIEDVVIGIVGCNWGGTSASAWMSREKLLEYPETACYVEQYDNQTRNQNLDEYLKAYDDYIIYHTEFERKVSNYYQTAANPNWEEALMLCGECKYPGPMGPKNWTRPYGLYETMIKRIAPYGFNGFIYYQGEDDDNRPYYYRRLLSSLVEQWRKDFKDEDLHFMIAQLPIFLNEGETDCKNWPFIREAQSDVSKDVPNCSMAVILETGEYHNIHPVNKETPGYRLAFLALQHIYGFYAKWDANGPEFDSAFTKDDAIYVDLKCCEGGLMVLGDDDFLEDVHMMDYLPEDGTFEIAGEDGVYYPARAQVLRGENITESKGEDSYFDMASDNAIERAALGSILTLKLSSEMVKAPVYGRYFWSNFAKVKIFGANGIPLAPFRTSRDDGALALGSRQGEVFGSPC